MKVTTTALARSVCPPYYQRLERMLAGMLTRKPVRLEDTSDSITEQLFDVDMQGNDLNVWTYETARKLVRYGHIGTLVDAPTRWWQAVLVHLHTATDFRLEN
jgi:hypothetical protein